MWRCTVLFCAYFGDWAWGDQHLMWLTIVYCVPCRELTSGSLSANGIEDGSEIRLVPAIESGVTVSDHPHTKLRGSFIHCIGVDVVTCSESVGCVVLCHPCVIHFQHNNVFTDASGACNLCNPGVHCLVQFSVCLSLAFHLLKGLHVSYPPSHG